MKIKIWILTEDSGDEAEDTLKALVKKMLRLVDPECQTHDAFVEFYHPAVDPKLTIRANEWKSPKYKDRVRLVQTITTEIDENFVLFHFDADRIWSEVYNPEGQADVSACENWQKFNDIILEPIIGFIEYKNPSRFSTRQNIQTYILERLFKVMPFYSIESWLFQNIDYAITLCNRHYQARDLEKFEDWKNDRTQIDECPQPKNAVCLQAKHNLELATNSYPADDAYNARRSFYQCAYQLGQSYALLEALERTRRR